MLSLFPSARTYHIGLFREKVSLQPVECITIPHLTLVNEWLMYFSLSKDYSKLPRNPTVDLCFLLDPLVASGGTSCAAINMILDWGIPSKICPSISFGQPYLTQTSVHSIKFLAVLASKMGLERIHSEFPELEVFGLIADIFFFLD